MAIKRGDLKTTIAWKDKRNVHILTSMHSSPLECNFCDQHGKAMKLAIIQAFNRHVRYVDKEAILPSCGPYHSSLLWFKIITLTIQTDTGEGRNTRGRKGASTSARRMKKTSPIHKPYTKT